MRRLIITMLTIVLWTHTWAQVTTEGKDFWFGYMENNDAQAPSSLEIFITSKVVANVEIFLYHTNETRTVVVTPGITHKEIVSFGTNNEFAARASGAIERKAVHVTSNQNVSVYAFNNRQASADATVVLPINSIGKEYYVSAYFENSPNDAIGTSLSPSELLVVATEDNTTIEITPSVILVSGEPAGNPFTITLSRGEIYQLQAFADLTGTYIRSVSAQADDCKNFAVFGGNKWTRVTGGLDCSASQGTTDYSGGFAADQLFEQMYPVNTWGKNYIAVPYEGRIAYLLRVMASEDDTKFTRNGVEYTLNAGEYETFVEDELISIVADKPVQVAQYSLTMSCDNNQVVGTGDPFMIMLSPNEQQLQEINFNALEATQLDDYYLTIVTRTNNTSNVFLDGAAISSGVFQAVSGTDYSAANLTINRGQDYNLSSSGGFIAYIYAFGQVESFGYVAGASLENLNLRVEGDDEDIGIIVSQACVNSLIDFSVDFETPPGLNPLYTEFEWDFGDGTTATGKEVQHVYTIPGEYTLTMIASDGTGSCGNSETITKTFQVEDIVYGDIIGAASVCPDVTNIAYSIDGVAGNTYQWFVDGGTIAQDNGDNIRVDWGVAKADASVKVLVTNSIGCIGDTVTLNVKIDQRLEPLTPQTDGFSHSEVCYTDRSRVRYFTPRTNGSQYQWFVSGGSFTADSDPTSNEVFVNWGNSASGRIWYREYNPLITDCEGYSDFLEVTIYSPIVPTPTISDVLCNGEANGAITLAISGGKGSDYTVAWSNGATGTSISGLVAGNYTATITDELGCEHTETFTVDEPEPLEVVGTVTTQPVRCFQEANGVAEVNVEGGTTFGNGEYRYTWESNGNATTTTSRVNTSLRAGNYTVTITDANGCQATTSFVITEPPLLEADIESIINDPICPQTSNGSVFINAKGGVPDYQFFWSSNPTTDNANATGLSQGNYTVRIVDANGCETSHTLTVEERFPKVNLPNAFSPNGDGVNDVFRAVTDCELSFSMQVYNKWGTVVFSSENIQEGWDGTYQGQPAPAGKYSYIMFYVVEINNTTYEQTFRGSFELIR
ncbi:gliding motility-associated C-terminal domain-containing protein [Roseivirga sp. UBA838]|uniref:T9SS type B sorting domain-containing protein n=1 Tax=Roseivirga sp. UBA838 TaxID=1947393 RepID=UPI00257D65F3|nr:gliding motility-associated C-terminal domain-containing protein [Roseivirga sp. UBA838]